MSQIRKNLLLGLQALNFDLEEAQQFLSGKGHFYEKIGNLYWNFTKGTTEKAKGTMAIAVGPVWVMSRPGATCSPRRHQWVKLQTKV